jgi:hypothetical protein
MRKAWCILSTISSVLFLILYLHTLKQYNQATSSEALWGRLIKCFEEGPSKVPPNKKCPTCPGIYRLSVLDNGQFIDSISDNGRLIKYQIKQTIDKNDSAKAIIFSISIRKLH